MACFRDFYNSDYSLVLRLFGKRRQALTDGATPALNAALGSHFTLTAAGNRTIGIPSNPTDMQIIAIEHKASGADRTLALNTGTGGFAYTDNVTALTATLSGKTDKILCEYNATANKWFVIAYTKGLTI